MAYDLSGKVKLIQDKQEFASGFTKREMVVTVADDKYPQDINIEFLQDRINLLDDIAVGQDITVSFDIRGREYNGRYFNNLVGWKIQAAENAPENSQVPATASISEQDIDPKDLEDFDDDIPF